MDHRRLMICNRRARRAAGRPKLTTRGDVPPWLAGIRHETPRRTSVRRGALTLPRPT
jgi:hypothetical protein